MSTSHTAFTIRAVTPTRTSLSALQGAVATHLSPISDVIDFPYNENKLRPGRGSARPSLLASEKESQ